jgi:hypothetical protein
MVTYNLQELLHKCTHGAFESDRGDGSFARTNATTFTYLCRFSFLSVIKESTPLLSFVRVSHVRVSHASSTAAVPTDYRVQQVVHSSLLRKAALRGTPRLSTTLPERSPLNMKKKLTAEN